MTNPSSELSLRKRNGKGVSVFGVRFALVVYIRPRMAHPASESSTSSSESKEDCKQASTLCHVGLLLMVFGPAKYVFVHSYFTGSKSLSFGDPLERQIQNYYEKY